jgi:hypothetical protein
MTPALAPGGTARVGARELVAALADCSSATRSMLHEAERGTATAGAGAWWLSIGDMTAVHVEAVEGWMRWTCPGALPRGADAADELLTVLLRQSGFPLALQHGHCSDDHVSSVRCDWPIAEDVDLQARVADLRSAFADVLGVSDHDAGARAIAGGAGSGGVIVMSAAELAALCGEAGWPATEHAAGVGVPLRCPRMQVAAVFQVSDTATVRVAAELGAHSCAEDATPLASSCQLAAHVLFAASDLVRFARPFARRAGAGVLGLGFEVGLGARPSVSEISHALGSLSVACESCGPEVSALVTTDLGQRLTERGWPGGRRIPRHAM